MKIHNGIETNIYRLDKHIKYSCNSCLQLLVIILDILLLCIFYYCILKRKETIYKQELITKVNFDNCCYNKI